MEGTINFHFDTNNGIYTIGNGEYAFQTRWSGDAGMVPFTHTEGRERLE